MVRNIVDVREYLSERLPSGFRPDWLLGTIAEMFFWSPEYRMVEECDLAAGLEVVVANFREGRRIPQYSVASWGEQCRLAEEPIVENDGTKLLLWCDQHGAECFGPVTDILLLGETWPMVCSELPHEVMSVKAASTEQTLMVQLRKLRVEVIA